MSRRSERVEELLRREIAGILAREEVRDPRLKPSAAIGITGVRVTSDLSRARVFYDVLSESLDPERVGQGLRAATPAIRSILGKKVALRRTPELRFEFDESVGRGARMEELLAELRTESPSEPESD